MVDLLGALGMIVLLGAFVGNAAGRLRADAIPYRLLNAVGAGILAWYSVQKDVIIFAILESVWCAAAVVGLVRTLLDRR